VGLLNSGSLYQDLRFYAGDEKQTVIDRGLTFGLILAAPFLDFIESPTHPNQKLLIVEIDGYAVAAPCKPLDDDEWLIVTAWFSRK